jgi:hypothetical protein
VATLLLPLLCAGPLPAALCAVDSGGLRLAVCSLAPTAGQKLCSERVASDAAHPLPLFAYADADASKALPDAAGGSKQACLDATRFDRLFDLSCAFTARAAAFHRVVDCLVPNFDVVDAALAAANDTAAVAAAGGGPALLVPHYLAPFAELLLPPALALPHLELSARRRCVRLAPGATVAYGTGTRNVTRAGLAARVARFRALALQRAGVAVDDSPAKTPKVVLLERTPAAGRNFYDAAAVRAALAGALRVSPVATYHGNETLLQTIRLFASASVVIGFHGAGVVNAVFGPQSAVIMELTLLADEAAPLPRPFRSNAIPLLPLLPPASRWLTYALPATAAHLPNATELAALKETKTDRDHVLKHASDIRVSPVDVFNIAAAIKAMLDLPPPRPRRISSLV